MKHLITDTIAAIITPPGIGGVGIIRISGEQAFALLSRITAIKPPIESHRLCLTNIINPDDHAIIDQVLAVYMKEPGTYTGEDVVELNCHGGPAVLASAMKLIIRLGARLAEPGEFTKRAFINGRMDLIQAEAVVDLINARTERAERAAIAQLEGTLSGRIRRIRDEVLSLLSGIEAAIDFPDDIEVDLGGSIDRIGGVSAELERLIETADEGRILREGFRLAIIGRPNVGKSSLLNALLGTERAIVTSDPGTTRDTIEEPANIYGFPFIVIDTAGIRVPKGKAEAMGIERAMRELSGADIAIVVVEGPAGIGEEDMALINKVEPTRRIIALNKIDLGNSCNEVEGGVAISALTGQGIEALKETILSSIIGNRQEGGGACINQRHRQILERAKEGLLRAEESCRIGLQEEVLATDIREALGALGEMDGVEVSDEVIKGIFQRFCVGK